MARFSGAESQFVSCDSEGMVKVWEQRMMKCMFTLDCGPYAANAVDFEQSGKMAAVASEDFSVKILDVENQKWALLESETATRATKTRCRRSSSTTSTIKLYRAGATGLCACGDKMV